MRTITAVMIVFLLALGGLYVWGAMVGENTEVVSGNSYSIGSCSERWTDTSYNAKSSYCFDSENCTITPEKERHNKLVEVLICACNNAKSNNYENSDHNQKIESVYEMLTSYELEAQEICENPKVSKIYY